MVTSNSRHVHSTFPVLIVYYTLIVTGRCQISHPTHWGGRSSGSGCYYNSPIIATLG